MKQRYIPFGYAICNGEPVCEPTEEKAVKKIFALYQNGASYQAVATYMQAQGFEYHVGKSSWNKNMVKRILENKSYLGNDEYPAIIDTEQFDCVFSLTASKTKSVEAAPAHIIRLKPFICCGECGTPYSRKPDKRCLEKWNCKNSDCKANTKITDKILVLAIITLLNRAIQSPKIIAISSTKQFPTNLEITRLQNEINREIDKPSCNEDYAKALIMACAVEKYNLCDDGSAERESLRLKDVFTNHQSLTEFDTDFFTDTVNKVLVHKDGKIGIKLKNNQTLEME